VRAAPVLDRDVVKAAPVEMSAERRLAASDDAELEGMAAPMPAPMPAMSD